MQNPFKNFYVATFLIIFSIFIVFQFVAYKQGNKFENFRNNLGQSVRNSRSSGEDQQKIFYPNGKIQAIFSYKDGKYHGPVQTYYENGSLFAVVNYVDGKKEGLEKSYYDTGELLYEKFYQRGKMVSLKEYDKKGNIIFESGS